MIIVPLKWFRNKRSGRICQVWRVVAPWIFVKYEGSKRELKFHRSQFVEGFESILPPAKAAN